MLAHSVIAMSGAKLAKPSRCGVAVRKRTAARIKASHNIMARLYVMVALLQRLI